QTRMGEPSRYVGRSAAAWPWTACRAIHYSKIGWGAKPVTIRDREVGGGSCCYPFSALLWRLFAQYLICLGVDLLLVSCAQFALMLHLGCASLRVSRGLHPAGEGRHCCRDMRKCMISKIPSCSFQD